LEVNVSPYEFGAKSAYPASCGFDVTACRYVSIEVETDDDGAEVPELADRLRDLEELENELSLAQRWVQGRLTEIREELAESVDDGDPELAAAVLRSVADGGAHIEELSRDIGAPPVVVQEALETLAERDVVHRDGRIWRLRED
jgi:ArsR family transcriptional regulator